jgi:hypothetical protein
MHGILLIVSDSRAGLQTAREAHLSGVPGNVANSICSRMRDTTCPGIDMRPKIVSDLRAIFISPDQTEAEVTCRLR